MHKKTFSLLLLCLLISGMPAFAQNSYLKSFKHNEDNAIINKIYNAPENGSFIFGHLPPNKASLTRIDSLGQLLWSKFIDFPQTLSSSNKFNSCTEIPGKGYVLNTIAFAPTGAIRYDVVLILIDYDGNLLWSKAYGAFANEPVMVLKYHEGKIYMAGTGNFTFNPTENLVMLCTFDLNGNLLRSNSRLVSNDEEISAIGFLDGWTILAGRSMATENFGDPLIIGADTSGILRYFYSLSIPGSVDFVNGVTESPDGLFIVGSCSTTPNAGSFCIKLSSVIDPPAFTCKLFKGTGENTLMDILYHDGKYFACGIGGNPSPLQHSMWIMEMDKDASPVSSNLYGDVEGRSFLYKLAVAGKNIIASGIYRENHYNTISILKLESDGSHNCRNIYPVSFEQKSLLHTRYFPAIENLQTMSESLISFPIENLSLEEKYLCNPDPVIAGFKSDSVLCEGSFITFTDTSKNATKWKWEFDGGERSSAPGNPVVKYNTAGIYSVKMIVSNPVSSDSVVKTIHVKKRAIPDAGKDTVVCHGTAFRLNGNGDGKYFWQPDIFTDSNTSKDPLLTLYKSSGFELTVTNSENCPASDSVYIKVLIPAKTLNDFDTVICKGESIKLDAGQHEGFKIKWNNTESDDRFLTVNNGIHIARIFNQCYSTERIFTVKERDCSLWYYVPNAFTPDNNGVNDIFKVYGGNIDFYELKILNRWGEIVYIGTEWNGKFNGHPCQSGTYAWTLHIKGPGGIDEFKSGTVDIITRTGL